MKYIVALSFTYTDVHNVIAGQLQSLNIPEPPYTIIPFSMFGGGRVVYTLDSAEKAFELLYAVTRLDDPIRDMDIDCYYLQEGQRDFH